MPAPFVPRPQRLLAALLSVHLALSACAAQAPGSALWPQPAELPPDRAAGTAPVSPQDFAPLQVRPNFRAPSAAHCARPPQMREVLGRGDGQEVAAHRAPSRPRLAAAPAPAAALSKTAPAAAAESALADAVEAAPAAPPQGAGATEAAALPARRAAGPVTAGVVDDNADFAEYLAFRARTQVAHRALDIRERYLLQVRDGQGRAVADAEVLVRSPQGQAAWARTDTAGKLWLHPDAFDARHAHVYEVTARRNGVESRGYLQRGQKSALELRLDAGAPQARARLDLVFLVDATGSMDDEIGKLKASLRSIADEVAGLPSRPDLCFALVAYRDKGDAFVLRSHDFTNDLGAFQRVLDQLRAAGGGDYPEAMNEALHETVHSLAWRGDGATRMVLLLADAPPHLDQGGPQYDEDLQAALGKGIKIFSVGASGLDRQGEYIQRQIAQYTGGRFVFLTYADAQRPASGPGRETVHDVRNYSVQTLDRLIVRLVREELGAL